eukprot:scaffold14554_cov36-Tisochrysis_lutea.AAC.1
MTSLRHAVFCSLVTDTPTPPQLAVHVLLPCPIRFNALVGDAVAAEEFAEGVDSPWRPSNGRHPC